MKIASEQQQQKQLSAPPTGGAALPTVQNHSGPETTKSEVLPVASYSFNLLVPAKPAIAKQNMLYLGRDIPLQVEIKDDKKFYSDATFWVSLAAIIVSLWTLWSANSSGQKARRQSINDEFWLRHVLYPLSIGPALEFYSKIVSELPADRFDATATAAAVDTFKQHFDASHSAILAKAIPLGVLGDDFYQVFQTQLEEIEDVVSTYCYENKDGFDPLASGSQNIRATVGSKISGHLMTILDVVKAKQVNMK